MLDYIKSEFQTGSKTTKHNNKFLLEKADDLSDLREARTALGDERLTDGTDLLRDATVARLATAGEVTVKEATAMRGLRKGSLGFRDSKIAREERREY